MKGNSDGCFHLLPYSSVFGRAWWSQLSCAMTTCRELSLWVPWTNYERALTVGSTHSPMSGVPVTVNCSTHLRQSSTLHLFAEQLGPRARKTIAKQICEGQNGNETTWETVTPLHMGAISQHPCRKGAHSLPTWSYHPCGGRRMLRLSLHMTAPLSALHVSLCRN